MFDSPRSRKDLQRITAGCLWLCVGSFLTVKGGLRIADLGGPVFFTISVAVLAGLVKGRLILDMASRKILARIERMGEDGRFLSFLSAKNWLMIIVMIIMGRLLRLSPFSPHVVWGIYTAVGVALVHSSRIFWLSH